MNRSQANGALLQLLSLLWAAAFSLAASTSMAEEGALQNKRLFFSPSQRVGVAAMGAEEESAQVMPIAPVAEPVGDAVQPRVIEPVRLPAKTVGIHFTAIVSGSDRVIILINGTPCRSLSHVLSEHQAAAQLLDCPQLVNPRISLSWSPAFRQIVVNHKGHKSTRLAVGESV